MIVCSGVLQERRAFGKGHEADYRIGPDKYTLVREEDGIVRANVILLTGGWAAFSYGFDDVHSIDCPACLQTVLNHIGSKMGIEWLRDAMVATCALVESVSK